MIPYFNSDRSIHVGTALLTILLCVISSGIWPDLFKDKPTSFSTVGFFITIYGVVFTIIEVLRAKAMAEVAAETAVRTAKRVETLYDVRNLAECQTLIENALDQLHEERTLSSSALSRIVKLYAAEFSTTYAQTTSRHRQHIGMVNSFAFSGRTKSPKLANVGKLKSTLVEMMAELSAANGYHLRKDPSQ